MPCAYIAAWCSGLSRMASRPPWTFGCSVFTRPSIISGKPVRSEISRTLAPSARSFAAVPPVETISTPCVASPAASSSRPLLSDSEISARRTGTRSVMFALRLAGAAESPADFAAQCRNFADDDKLAGALRLTAAVDPQAFLHRQIAAAAAEVPRRRALRTKNCPHAVGGDRRFDPRRQVEADRIRRGLADFLATLGQELVRPAQLLAVVAEHQASLVDHCERANITGVARLQAAGLSVPA